MREGDEKGMRRSWRGKECIERNGLTPVDGKGCGWCTDCRNGTLKAGLNN